MVTVGRAGFACGLFTSVGVKAAFVFSMATGVAGTGLAGFATCAIAKPAESAKNSGAETNPRTRGRSHPRKGLLPEAEDCMRHRYQGMLMTMIL